MKMTYYRVTAIVVALSLMLAPASVIAGQATSQMLVTATVQASCNLSTTADLAFGTLAPAATTATAQGALDVQCTPGTTASIQIDSGQYLLAGQRTMRGPGTSNLPYTLYRDSGHSAPWGSTDSQRLAYKGTGRRDQVPVYGVATRSPSTISGDHQDVVQIIVEF
jgi:spore coat protein U-like protein